MGAAVGGVDVVGEAGEVFAVAVDVLQRNVHAELLVVGGAADGDGLVQNGFALVQVADHRDDAVVELEGFGASRRAAAALLFAALVLDHQLDAGVEVGPLAQAVGDGGVVVGDVAEDVHVGDPADLGAAFGTLADFFEFFDHVAAAKRHGVDDAVAGDFDVQPAGQGVGAAHAHAVQAARDLVAVAVELAAGVQHGHDNLDRGPAVELRVFVLVLAHGDAAAVVFHGDAVVGAQRDDDVVAVARQGFVDGVVDHFPHQVVQAAAVGAADVHGRAFANGRQPFEHGDAVFGVAVGGAGGGVNGLGRFGRRLGHDR